VLLFHALDPPAWMIPVGDRIAIGPLYQLCSLPEEPAQASVQEIGLQLDFGRSFGGFDRLIYECEFVVEKRITTPYERKRNTQDAINVFWRQTLSDDSPDRFRTPQISPYSKCQCLYSGTQVLIN
jgi:hypothetical protein